jgi:hypothetical protein
MSAAGRPPATVVQDEAPIDLAALPDPRPMVAVTGTACAGSAVPGARDSLRRERTPEPRADRVPDGAAAGRPLSGP